MREFLQPISLLKQFHSLNYYQRESYCPKDIKQGQLPIHLIVFLVQQLFVNNNIIHIQVSFFIIFAVSALIKFKLTTPSRYGQD